MTKSDAEHAAPPRSLQVARLHRDLRDSHSPVQLALLTATSAPALLCLDTRVQSESRAGAGDLSKRGHWVRCVNPTLSSVRCFEDMSATLSSVCRRSRRVWVPDRRAIGCCPTGKEAGGGLRQAAGAGEAGLQQAQGNGARPLQCPAEKAPSLQIYTLETAYLSKPGAKGNAVIGEQEQLQLRGLRLECQ